MYTTFGPKGKSHPPIPSNIIIAMNVLPPEIGTVNNDPNANAIRAMCKCECMRNRAESAVCGWQRWLRCSVN